MILHWRQLPLYYGGGVTAHRGRFFTAGRTTYGLLCCRLAPGDDRLASSGRDHAEGRLLASRLWAREVPEALSRRSPLDRGALVVTLALNRSPCRSCSHRLTAALTELQWRYAARFERARFVLAARGAYEGRATDAGYFANATTVGDLRRLDDAGWELCVLRVGAALPPSGRQLLRAIETITGRRGVVRLDA